MVSGKILALDPGLTRLERFYIKMFGAPINGLRIRLRRIIPAIPKNPGKVLDAGCGRGAFSFTLAQLFPQAEIVGVDMDSQQLSTNEKIAEYARLENVDFQEADVTKLPFNNEFDTVLSVDNLEHVEDDEVAIGALLKSLKKGGTLVVHVPAYERRWFFFKFQTNFDVPGHFRPGYRKNDIENKLLKFGVTITKSQYTYGFAENLSNNISYAITKAEAKNKVLYALCFPLINFLAWMGRNGIPVKGAGILIVANKK